MLRLFAFLSFASLLLAVQPKTQSARADLIHFWCSSVAVHHHYGLTRW